MREKGLIRNPNGQAAFGTIRKSEYGRKNPNRAEYYRKKPHTRAGDNREDEPAKARKTENKENKEVKRQRNRWQNDLKHSPNQNK